MPLRAYDCPIVNACQEIAVTELVPAPVPPEAVEVLRRFMDAADRGDRPAMEACVTRKTIESGSMNATDPGVKLTMGEPRAEGDLVVIPVTARPADAPPDSPPVMELPCLIVREDGQWKFDLPGSMDRLFGGGLESMVQQLASTMATAMEGVGQAMADGLKEAFGAMSGEQAPAAANDADGSDAASPPAAPRELPEPKRAKSKRKARDAH